MLASLLRSPIIAHSLVLAVLLASAPAFAQDNSANLGVVQQDVTFTDTSPLGDNSELVRRLLSPFAATQLEKNLARAGKYLTGQPLDLAQEKFTLYVPAQRPPHGYALIVFVPPWDDARLPHSWAEVLDRHGAIFVTAAHSGNDVNMLGRRVPLALVAEQNIVHRYAVDPEHIYIAGFSGGSRVAMRIALGYADIFRGALLHAGSDPIGSSTVPLPPKDLFLRFQDAVRLVFIAGEEDSYAVNMDRASMRAMRESCVFDTDEIVRRGAGHQTLDATTLNRALEALLHPAAPDPAALAQCRASIESEVAAKLQGAEALLADGKHDEAQKALIDIDARYGGLAAPQSVVLWEK
jgi:pimeloyl-ACP methyl ester carboxylesterase